jgi:hypothetical protein
MSNKVTKSKLRLVIAASAALLAELVAPVFTGVAQAAPPQFTQVYVRPDRHKALTATGVMICATPSAASTAATETLVKITFPTDTGATDFVVNSTASNWTVDTLNLPAGATAWPGIGTATNVTTKTVTFPSNDLTAATQYCFHTAARLTMGSATSSVNIIGATLVTFDNAGIPAPVNQTNWSTAVVTDDQIVVSAVVPPNFSISLSANADAFAGNLDPSNIVSTTGVTVTIQTNAVGGWIAWAKDQYQGLFSATASYTIDSGLKNPYPTQLHVAGDPAFDLVPSGGGVGREGYVMDTDLTTDATGGCTVAVDAAFNSASGNGGGFLSNTNFLPIANCTGAAPATSDGDVLTLIERAVIRGGTPAGSDYTDVITVVGAGNF